MRIERTPIYVAIFLLTLSAPQLVATASQFYFGFRPFAHDPVRVPLSWDMFATRVERCTLSWGLPLKFSSQSIYSLRDIELPLEWDIIFDHVDDYRAVKKGICQSFAMSPTQAQMHCFLPDGTETEEASDCD
jgi:hypothetical protein